jgi:hypothetical protein
MKGPSEFRIVKPEEKASEPDEQVVLDYLKRRIKTVKHKRDFLAERIAHYNKFKPHIRPTGVEEIEKVHYTSPDTQKQLEEKGELIKVLEESLAGIQMGNKALLRTFWDELNEPGNKK